VSVDDWNCFATPCIWLNRLYTLHSASSPPVLSCEFVYRWLLLSRPWRKWHDIGHQRHVHARDSTSFSTISVLLAHVSTHQLHTARTCACPAVNGTGNYCDRSVEIRRVHYSSRNHSIFTSDPYARQHESSIEQQKGNGGYYGILFSRLRFKTQ